VKTIHQRAIAASIWKRQATSGFEYFDFTISHYVNDAIQPVGSLIRDSRSPIFLCDSIG